MFIPANTGAIFLASAPHLQYPPPMARGSPEFLPDDAPTLEVQRAAILRRRVVWFCIILLALLAMSVLGTVMDVIHPFYEDGTRKQTVAIDLPADAIHIGLLVAMLVYVTRWKPDRARLVFALSIVVVAGAAIAMASEVLVSGMHPNVQLGKTPHPQAALDMALTAVTNFWGIQLLASIIVPMRWRESLRIALPLWAIFTAVILGLIPKPWLDVHWIFPAFFPLAALPGMAWSAWRFREIDERLASRELKEKYGEVTAELEHARRIHEALFPPTIHRGPIRLTYRYEPMREIGGDFLFVHPLVPPPAEPASVMNLVLIDVSGHGVPAALAVNRLHGELQRVFADQPDIRPGDLLEQLNRYTFAALANQGVFATALCLRLDGARGELLWASAGHPPAFLRRPGAEVIELASTCTMLGVAEPAEFDADERRERLGLADVVLAYTDGAPDTRDGKRTDFGIDRIREFARQGARMGKLAAGIMESVNKHRRGRIADDILIVEVVHAGGELTEWSRSQSGVMSRPSGVVGRR